MAKKTNKKSAGENQSESFDRELSELREALDSNVKGMAKMDFEDFKREMLEHFKTINENIFILVDELTKERERTNGCFDVIVKKTKERDEVLDKAFEVLKDREEGITAMVFWLACKALGHKVTRKDREAISGIMGYHWTPENEKNLQNWAVAQSLS